MFQRKPSPEGRPSLDVRSSIESMLPPAGSPQRMPPPLQSAQHNPGAFSSAAPQPTTASPAPHEEGLVVIGKGTRVRGTIGDCQRLEVHGILEADVVADVLIIREGGGIKGTVKTDNAEIHGVFEGTLIVHEHLDLQSTALVAGEICYQTLSIQTGGKMRGNIVCHDHEAEAGQHADPEPTADIIAINVQNRMNGSDHGSSALDAAAMRGTSDFMT